MSEIHEKFTRLRKQILSHPARTKVVSKVTTRHACFRLLQRYGVKLTEEMWEELALSLASGDHPLAGRGKGGMEIYEVGFVTTNGETKKVKILWNPMEARVITILPRQRRKRSP